MRTWWVWLLPVATAAVVAAALWTRRVPLPLAGLQGLTLVQLVMLGMARKHHESLRWNPGLAFADAGVCRQKLIDRLGLSLRVSFGILLVGGGGVYAEKGQEGGAVLLLVLAALLIVCYGVITLLPPKPWQLEPPAGGWPPWAEMPGAQAPASRDRGCDYCADERNMACGHVRPIATDAARGTLLLWCPRCGSLYQGFHTSRFVERLDREIAIRLYPDVPWAS